MNNRYLYRAKRTDNGEWVEGYIIPRKYEGTDKIFEAHIVVDAYEQIGVFNMGRALVSEVGYECFVVDPSTICQCTGLRDKNGKLIWENDIVRDDNGNIYKAFWRDRYYQFSWICVKLDKLPIGAKWDFWSIRNYEIEVIGSAIDNPELLEV